MTEKPSQWSLTVDYRPAIAKAVEWLGKRYLLAEPIRALPASGRSRIPVNSLARDRHVNRNEGDASSRCGEKR